MASSSVLKLFCGAITVADCLRADDDSKLVSKALGASKDETNTGALVTDWQKMWDFGNAMWRYRNRSSGNYQVEEPDSYENWWTRYDPVRDELITGNFTWGDLVVRAIGSVNHGASNSSKDGEATIFVRASENFLTHFSEHGEATVPIRYNAENQVYEYDNNFYAKQKPSRIFTLTSEDITQHGLTFRDGTGHTEVLRREPDRFSVGEYVSCKSGCMTASVTREKIDCEGSKGHVVDYYVDFANDNQPTWKVEFEKPPLADHPDLTNFEFHENSLSLVYGVDQEFFTNLILDWMELDRSSVNLDVSFADFVVPLIDNDNGEQRFLGVAIVNKSVHYNRKNKEPAITNDACYLLQFGVDKSIRGTGLATGLLNAIVRTIQQSAPEIKKMCLHVKALNTAAIKFYEKVGFKRKQHLPGFFGDHGDALFYCGDFDTILEKSNLDFSKIVSK